jgi:hypothetical protein
MLSQTESDRICCQHPNVANKDDFLERKDKVSVRDSRRGQSDIKTTVDIFSTRKLSEFLTESDRGG